MGKMNLVRVTTQDVCEATGASRNTVEAVGASLLALDVGGTICLGGVTLGKLSSDSLTIRARPSVRTKEIYERLFGTER